MANSSIGTPRSRFAKLHCTAENPTTICRYGVTTIMTAPM